MYNDDFCYHTDYDLCIHTYAGVDMIREETFWTH
jgi:hypothetical protein